MVSSTTNNQTASVWLATGTAIISLATAVLCISAIAILKIRPHLLNSPRLRPLTSRSSVALLAAGSVTFALVSVIIGGGCRRAKISNIF